MRARPRAGVLCLGPEAGWQLRARLRPLRLRLRRPPRLPPHLRSPRRRRPAPPPPYPGPRAASSPPAGCGSASRVFQTLPAPPTLAHPPAPGREAPPLARDWAPSDPRDGSPLAPFPETAVRASATATIGAGSLAVTTKCI